MLTQRENVEAILAGEQPDYYLDIMDAIAFIPDPVFLGDLAPQDGLPHKDSWGVTNVFEPGQPGQYPVNEKDEVKVIHDIEKWEEEVHVPSIDNLDWSMAQGAAKAIDRNQKISCVFSAGGLFERAHFLMGMEDAFCAYIEEPELMTELLTAIKDYKINYIRTAKEKVNPDAIFFQDDWGSKQNLFLPPDLWREIIKPLQKEISDVIHECGMLYIHHSDCFCEPIAQDMVEIGIDVWQGVIPENNIPEIQRITREAGKQLVMQGGIDTPAIDIAGMSEEEVRAGVRADMDRCLPGGKFFIGCPGGVAFTEPNNTWLQDERLHYARQWAVDHPIGGKLASDDFDMEKMLSWYAEEKEILPSEK